MQDPLCTRKLVKQGARCNAPDRSGLTPMHYSILSGSLEVLAVLLKDAENIAIDLKDDMGMTPLLTAVGLGFDEHVSMLLRRHADPTICTADGMPPLHLATKTGQLGSIRALMKWNPASLTSFDSKGRTAVHLAASEGNPTVLEVFLTDSSTLNLLDEIGTLVLPCRSCSSARPRASSAARACGRHTLAHMCSGDKLFVRCRCEDGRPFSRGLNSVLCCVAAFVLL